MTSISLNKFNSKNNIREGEKGRMIPNIGKRILALVITLALLSGFFPLTSIKADQGDVESFEVIPYDISARINIPLIEGMINQKIYISEINHADINVLNQDLTKNCIDDSNTYNPHVYAVNHNKDVIDNSKEISIHENTKYYFYLVINEMLHSKVEIKTLETVNAYWTNPGHYDIGWYGNKNEFEINSSEQLAGLAVLNNGLNGVQAVDFSGKTIHLTSSVDVSKYVWTPIGTETNPFKGVFDGENYKDSSLYSVQGIHTNKLMENHQGLFGCIKNSIIKGVSVDAGYVMGCNFLGGIAGNNFSSKIQNTRNTATIKGISVIGGIAGKNDDKDSQIINSANEGLVIGDIAGGIIGSNFGEVKNSCNKAKINGVNMLGGISGHNDMARLINVYNTGSITGTNNIGGIAGESYESVMMNSYNTGLISGSLYVGGIAGNNVSSRIQNVYYYGHEIAIGGEDAVQTGTISFIDFKRSLLQGKAAQISQANVDIGFCDSIGIVEIQYPDSYTSSDNTIAMINNEKKIIAQQKPGTANIVGSIGQSQNQCLIIKQKDLTKDGFTGIVKYIKIDINIPCKVIENKTFPDVTRFNVFPYDNSVKIDIPYVDGAMAYKVYMTTSYHNSLNELNNDNKKVLIRDSSYQKCFYSSYKSNNGQLSILPNSMYYFYFVTNNGQNDNLQDRVQTRTLARGVYWTEPGNYDIDWYKKNSRANDYYISTPQQLAGLAVLNNGLNNINPVDFSNKTIHLVNSVDMHNYLWTPIGTETRPFNGSFDGGVYDKNNDCEDCNIIQCLNISTESPYQGLFGCTNKFVQVKKQAPTLNLLAQSIMNDFLQPEIGQNPQIQQLENKIANSVYSGQNEDIGGKATETSTIKNIIIQYGYVKGGSKIGSVAGVNYSVVKNISVFFMVVLAKDQESKVGGIVGLNIGTISNVETNAKVTGKNSVGGIAGKNFGRIVNSKKTGELIYGGNYVGGVAGSNINLESNENSMGEVLGSENTSMVSAYGNHVGGVVGFNIGKAENIQNTNEVKGVNNIGGIVGYNKGFIVKAKNAGLVNGKEESVGGIVGHNIGSSKQSSIKNSENNGNVIGRGKYVGGIVGAIIVGLKSTDVDRYGEVFEVYASDGAALVNNKNTGLIQGTSTHVAGIVGYAEAASLTNCNNYGIILGPDEDSLGGVFGERRKGKISDSNSFAEKRVMTQDELSKIVDKK